jgi:hypothetical protein
VLTLIAHALGANVENLTLHEFDGSSNGSGNSLNNVMVGNSSKIRCSAVAAAIRCSAPRARVRWPAATGTIPSTAGSAAI